MDELFYENSHILMRQRYGILPKSLFDDVSFLLKFVLNAIKKCNLTV